MSNMSYCRFENTLEDLLDCYANWSDQDDLRELEVSAQKRAQKRLLKAQKRLLKLCRKIVDVYEEQGDE